MLQCSKELMECAATCLRARSRWALRTSRNFFAKLYNIPWKEPREKHLKNKISFMQDIFCIQLPHGWDVSKETLCKKWHRYSVLPELSGHFKTCSLSGDWMILPNNCTFTDLENIADLRQLRNVYLCSYYDLRPGTRKTILTQFMCGTVRGKTTFSVVLHLREAWTNEIICNFLTHNHCEKP